MHSELENRLRETYPQLLRNLHGDPMVSPLGRGIEVEDGWYDLLDRLFANISCELLQRPDEHFTLTQVKQKFGALRVYTTATDNLKIAELIVGAMREAEATCELCGATEANLFTYRGAMRTLCQLCRPSPKDTVGS